MSGTDSTAQPTGERQTNRNRRPQVRKTPRANFPLITVADEKRTADLDVTDPTAGGGRGFRYQWEEEAQNLQAQINAGGGGGGGGGASFVFTQSAPAATWVIDHHLGLIPDVLVLDNTGQQMIAELRFPSNQTCVVLHSAPYAGTAYLRS